MRGAKKNGRRAVGLMAQKKTPPPFLPTVIGIVGSLEGAAVRDVIRTLKIRMPTVHVIVYPAPAQGAEAAAKIAAAIQIANRRGECETLIVCRGGGNMEDLWAFNEEAVVAAIVHSDLPVISGIGHEIDETLSDLAADVRAPTPTGAAIFAVPDRAELNEKWQNAADIFARAIARTLADKAQQLDWSAGAFVRPSALLEGKIAHQQRLTASFFVRRRCCSCKCAVAFTNRGGAITVSAVVAANGALAGIGGAVVAGGKSIVCKIPMRGCAMLVQFFALAILRTHWHADIVLFAMAMAKRL